jgi:hypothetical protein
MKWEKERTARACAVRKVIQSLKSVISMTKIKTSVRRRLLLSTAYTVALYGAGVCYEGVNSVRRIETELAEGHRLIRGTGKKTTRAAMTWELDLIPLYWQAVESQIRLLLRVLSRKEERGTASLCLRNLTASRPKSERPSQYWGWLRRAAILAKRVLPKEHHNVVTLISVGGIFGRKTNKTELKDAGHALKKAIADCAKKEMETLAKRRWTLSELRRER